MLDAMKLRQLAPVSALVIALALTACSTPTLSGGTGGNGGSGGTSGRPGSSDGGTGSDGGTDDGGTDDDGAGTGDGGIDSVEGRLPAGWPEDVVVPEGEIVQGVSMGGAGWVALIDVDDTAGAFAASSTSLQAAGYTVVSELVSDSGSVGIYENAERQVQVAVASAADAGWTMSYTITTKG
jgi:hypothetical protein